jgi:hypothetical protein
MDCHGFMVMNFMGTVDRRPPFGGSDLYPIGPAIQDRSRRPRIVLKHAGSLREIREIAGFPAPG